MEQRALLSSIHAISWNKTGRSKVKPMQDSRWTSADFNLGVVCHYGRNFNFFFTGEITWDPLPLERAHWERQQKDKYPQEFKKAAVPPLFQGEEPPCWGSLPLCFVIDTSSKMRASKHIKLIAGIQMLNALWNCNKMWKGTSITCHPAISQDGRKATSV